MEAIIPSLPVVGANEDLPLDDLVQRRELLGEGGMAQVWRATHLSTGKDVAVKRLRDEVASEPRLVLRFRNEADLLRRFEHPSIVRFEAFGTVRGSPALVTEYVSGGSLLTVARSGDLTVRRGIGYALEILDALELIHGEKACHRDIKPSNILIGGDDVARLADFGVAVHPDRRMTLVGARVGTPTYMPPEQMQDAPGSSATHDLYALATTLYRVLTRRKPIRLMVPHLREEALELLPESLAIVVDRATCLDPDARYQRARDMALDLSDAIEHAR